MKFKYDCEKLLGCDQDCIAILEPSHKEFIKPNNYLTICEIIDGIGGFSSVQKGLKSTISSDKFFNNENYKSDKLFLKVKDNNVIGFLRIGVRHLYISDNQTITQGIDTLCVLDFYVFHTIQGQGHGKTIFDKMLRFINTQPYKLAYDCPTQQMIKFLYKHYSLTKYIKQNNNFIVYSEFFKGRVSSGIEQKQQIDYNYVLNHQAYGNDKFNYLDTYNNQYTPNVKKNLQLSGAQVIKIRSDLNTKYSNSNVNTNQNMNQPNYNINIQNGIKNYSITPDYTKSKLNLIVPSPDNKSFNLLNSNIDKRFHNYFLNSNSNDSTKVVSTQSTGDYNLSDFKDKFNEKIYLKNLIEKNAKELVDRQEKMRELESKAYRNPSPNFYAYQKNSEFATIFQNKKLNNYNNINNNYN